MFVVGAENVKSRLCIQEELFRGVFAPPLLFSESGKNAPNEHLTKRWHFDKDLIKIRKKYILFFHRILYD